MVCLEIKKIYIGTLLLIALFEVIMIINIITRASSLTGRNLMYFISYILLLFASISFLLVILFTKKKENASLLYSILMRIFSLFIVAWLTLISCGDMMVGNYPIVYLTILLSLGGLVALSPIVILGLIALSLPFIIIVAFKYKDLLSFANDGGMFNILVFIIMSVIVALRMYYVTIQEANYTKLLTKLNNTDYLTGLGNERNYFNTIDNIDELYEKYIVVMMDVNGLKNTNNTFGHRYGCELIKTTGKILPSIFLNSLLFHIGGDEFVAIVINEDYENIDERIHVFEDKLENSYINYEGVDILLSVAKGVSIKMENEHYNEVYARADKKMYKNKKEMKQKLNINNRE